MNTIVKNIIWAFVIVAIGAGVGYASQDPMVKEQVALATTVKPESFTELYFENHLTLPKSTTTETAEAFSFTIHNLENKTITYPYEVFIEDTDGHKSVIAQEKVTLKQNEYKTIPMYYQQLTQVKRAKVEVNLTDKNQEIHYWIGEDNK